MVLLSHRGRTVLSRSYGMADTEKGIRNHEGVAFNLYGGPFVSLSIVQLAQQGKVKLWDTVGTHLTGFTKEIAGCQRQAITGASPGDGDGGGGGGGGG